MKKLLTFSLVVGILAVLIIHVSKNAEVLREVAWMQHPWYLLGHLVLVAAMYTFFVVGWKKVVASVGGEITWSYAAASWLIPNLGKYVPGKVAMLAGRIEMVRARGVRRSAAASAMVFENVTQILAAMPFFALALAAGLRVGTQAMGWVVGGVVLAGLLLYARPDSLTRMLNLLLKKLKREPLEVTPTRVELLNLLGVETLAWVAYAVSGVLLARALGLADEASSLVLGVTFVAAWLMGYLSVLTPGGLGVREVVFVALLAGSTGSAEAATLALVARITWTLIEMGGVILGLWLRRSSTSYS